MDEGKTTKAEIELTMKQKKNNKNKPQKNKCNNNKHKIETKSKKTKQNKTMERTTGNPRRVSDKVGTLKPEVSQVTCLTE